MAKWVIIAGDGSIGKDGVFYSGLDMSWIPSTIRAIHTDDEITCEVEYGDATTEARTSNASSVATSSFSWWSSVSSTWQTAYDAEQAAIAAAAAEAAAAPVDSRDNPE